MDAQQGGRCYVAAPYRHLRDHDHSCEPERDILALGPWSSRCPPLALAAWQAGFVWPFFADDSFISLRYAQRLLHGDGLTWTEDASGAIERVEGYSNLLWVLLTAGLGALGLDLVTAARALGAACTALALLLLARAMRPACARTALLAAVPPLLVVSNQPVLVWTLAGLEGPLLLLLLAWGFGGLVRWHAIGSSASTKAHTLLALGAPFALACWTRPDAPLWALTAGCGLVVHQLERGAVRALLAAAWFGALPMFAVAAQLTFRLLYYGDWVPNTAHVKAAITAASLAPGRAFVQHAIAATPGLTTAAIAGAVLALAHRPARRFALVLALPVLAWWSYLVAIGGDHFPGLRLLHGVIAPMALLAGLGAAALRAPLVQVACALVFAIGHASYDAIAARTDAGSREAKGEVWEWRGKVLGEELRRAFGSKQPRIAVDAAGALPFYSQLPALDMLGLCDRTIGTTPFPAWLDTVLPGTPKPAGHLCGNGAYVIDQAPDLMLFSTPPGMPVAVYVSACEFESDERFLRDYRLVLFDLGERDVLPGRREPLVAFLWVRIDGRVGVERSADRIVVPAWLFGSMQLPGPVQNCYQAPGPNLDNLRHVAQWLETRRFVAVPTDDGAPALHAVDGTDAQATLTTELPAGTWHARVEPAGCGAQADDVALQHAGEAVLTLRIPPGAQPKYVVFERR